MATELGTETGTILTEERTWRTQIESAQGETPWVKAHREVVRTMEGQIISKVSNQVEVLRSLPAAIQNNDEVTIMLGGKATKYTAMEIALVIPAFIDLWRSQDLAALAAALNPPA